MPSSLRLAIGKHELWRSLDTDSLAVALRRFHQAIAWIEGELDRARKIVGGTVVSTLSGPWRDADHEVATRVQRAARPNVLEGSQSAAIELTLAQVFERFMRDPTRDWSSRTTLAYETTRRLALSIIGDKPMSGLTRATCREFVETLRYLPKSASKRFPGLTLREDAT